MIAKQLDNDLCHEIGVLLMDRHPHLSLCETSYQGEQQLRVWHKELLEDAA